MDIECCIDRFVTFAKVERNLSERTIKAYKSDLKSVSTFFGEKNAGTITADDLREYLQTLEKPGHYKDTTIKRKIATLKVFFGFLEEEEIIPLSPTRRIRKKYEITKRLPRVMSVREVKRLLRAPHREKVMLEELCKAGSHNNGHPNKRIIRCCRDKAILEVLFSTGIRIGELVNLDLEDLDRSSRTMLILGKGRKERIAYISSDEVLHSLKKYISYRMDVSTTSHALFLNKFGGRLTIYSINNIFRHYSNLAGIKNHYTPHSLRHTMATMLMNNGADIRSVQEILGHASIVTTQIYTEVSSTRKQRVLMKFNQRNRMSIS